VYALALHHVFKHFANVVAVEDLSLQIESGWMFGLLGPNGAGKTTTLRMILNIIQPDRGQILLWGQTGGSSARQVGYLPEERGLYRKMKVLDVLIFLGAIKGMRSREARDQALLWLERMELTTWATRKVEELSKGMQQQVQFIAAVLHRPELLILDEPFTGLDPVNTNRLKDIILELNGHGTTVILSTHQMDQVEKLCHHICLIDRGKKILDGRLSDIKGQYGRNTVRMQFDGPKTFLENNRLVQRMDLYGQYVELQLMPSADPQELLRTALGSTRLMRFEIVEPSLNDIFIEKVRKDHG